MIGIRSITYHMPRIYNEIDFQIILRTSRMWQEMYPLIRTQRVALVPDTEPDNLMKFSELSKLCDISDIRWFNISIDPWQTSNKEKLFKYAEDILSEYGRAFVNVLAVKENSIDSEVVERSGRLIKQVAQLSNNGKDNFRLGVSINVKPNGPFFPFTYSAGILGFSIALELTQEINDICTRHSKEDLSELREIIRTKILQQVKEINTIAKTIENKCQIKFLGFDFSVAPIIAENGSVISIVQRMGIYNFGKVGTLFATAYLTDMLKSLESEFQSVGFHGIMYSMLEDLELCTINNQRGVSIDDLIKVSTMCGCGVDMVPVPIDISLDELNSIFLEVYTISTRLNKPLGIRVLPIPQAYRSRVAYTNLKDDADFIANTRVLDMDINLVKSNGKNFSFYGYNVNNRKD